MKPGSLPSEPTLIGSGISRRITYRLGSVMLLAVFLTHARPLLVPLVLAVLLAFLMFPVVRFLTRRRVPSVLAIIVAQGVATLPIVFLGTVFAGTLGEFVRKLPEYQAVLAAGFVNFVNWGLSQFTAGPMRVALEQNLTGTVLPEVMQEGLGFARGTLQFLTTALVATFLMLVINLFLLLEARRLREKIVEAFGRDNALLSSLEAIGEDVRAYVVAKTAMSALTGVCVWLLLAGFGVDFAVLWGLLAFPLNFIPTVGAILASVPPMLVAGIDPEMSPWGLAGVCGGLLAVNGVIGSYIDPRFVGRSVEISPLVVLLSMLTWGFLWGPIGAILAVPIMVSVKVICSHVPGLERIATLLKA
jgi:predicted PurR-regulated permease PerM